MPLQVKNNFVNSTNTILPSESSLGTAQGASSIFENAWVTVVAMMFFIYFKLRRNSWNSYKEKVHFVHTFGSFDGVFVCFVIQCILLLFFLG